MKIHLDLIGGIAGDMFIAALLDAFPQHAEGVVKIIERMLNSTEARCAVRPHNDSLLQGSRFIVQAPGEEAAHAHSHSHSHPDDNHHHHHNDHTHWSEIKSRLLVSIPDHVARHAIGIFQLLADAEGRVHGVPSDQVAFHEVGAWDSIADIVGAAYLIACSRQMRRASRRHYRKSRVG
jgi:uncharacterized protein (DUF111 family)